MKKWFVLAALGIAGCGGGEILWGPARERENVSERPALGHPWQRTSATLAPDCPKPVSPGPRAAPQVSRALYKALPKLYPTLNRKGAAVQGMFSLAGGLPTTIKTKRYVGGPAFRACGDKVTKASWVAFVLLPNSPAESSEHVVFMVRTAKGWKVWYEWSPQNPEGTVVDVAP